MYMCLNKGLYSRQKKQQERSSEAGASKPDMDQEKQGLYTWSREVTEPWDIRSELIGSQMGKCFVNHGK